MNEQILSDLGEKIFADRYARKTHNNFVLGDKVLVKYNGSRESGFGTVLSLSDDTVSVKLESGLNISCDKSNVAKPIETVDEMFQRVAVSVASAEENKEQWTTEFWNLLNDFKFIPGGRILAAAGSEGLSSYNCFVIPSPKDCREGIIETLQTMIEIMSRGGGVGINISSLRQKDSPVRGVSGRSSGAVSWGALYSFATGLICQGGSRRGALGLVVNDWHPDILEFISCKQKEGGAFSNANISVAVSDDFMRAVQNDSDWQLVFPDTRHPDYDKNWDGDLQAWRTAGYPVLTHKTIKAKELWDVIVENAWSNGEPGVWFIDKANAMSNSHYLCSLNCTNPCFEEPLPASGVCCLGSLNLPVFIKDDDVSWDELEKAIHVAVRFLDDVIDITPYFHDEIEQRQKSERRIGLGTMGLAEALIRLGLRYGSDDSIEFIDKLYGFIANKAYLASVELAKEKGAFPVYDERFLKSGFMKQMPGEVRDAIAKHGIRNMTILTQAPTGSTATMVGTSTGIEPFFDLRYTRKSQLGVDYEYVKVYSEWKEDNPTGVQTPTDASRRRRRTGASHPGLRSKNADDNDSALPDYFVTTKDITTDEHVAVQSAVQRWVDASISKTVNLKKEATRDDVSNVFKNLYESGCKGGTVYRDGSRKEQVLNRQEQSEAEEGVVDNASHPVAHRTEHGVKELPYKRLGATVSMKTPSGTMHLTMNHDFEGQPFEVFIEIGKAGSDLKAMSEAIGRLISLIFRLEPIPPTERALQIIEQLNGIGGARSVGFGKNKVLSLPDAISKALVEHYEINLINDAASSQNNRDIRDGVDSVGTHLSADICPVCGQSSYVREEACTHCVSCGFSEC